MKRLLVFVLAIAAVTTSLGGQQPTKVIQHKPQATIDQLTMHVKQIKEADEKGRWQANVGAWRVLLGAKGHLGDAQTVKLNSLLTEMKENVADVASKGELERWNENIAMWDLVSLQKGVPDPAAMKTMNDHLQKIKKNIAAVKDRDEYKRWSMNVELWMTFLRRR